MPSKQCSVNVRRNVKLVEDASKLQRTEHKTEKASRRSACERIATEVSFSSILNVATQRDVDQEMVEEDVFNAS